MGGKRLASHTPADVPCHGDVLISEYRARFLSLPEAAPDDAAVAAARSEALRNRPVKSKRVHTLVPTRICGIGPPVTVIKGDKERLLCDGGGLCSPGLWPPWRRLPISPFGLQVWSCVESRLCSRIVSTWTAAFAG